LISSVLSYIEDFHGSFLFFAGEIADSRHEADMILPPKLKKSRNKRSFPPDSDSPSEVYRTVKLWPRGQIPYTISYDLSK
jgi:hypothetical protein